MILGSIQNFENNDTLPLIIKEIMRYLKENPFDNKCPGIYTIRENEIFAKVIEGTTDYKNNRLPEVHREYIDLQYIINGNLKIGYGSDSSKYEISKEYNKTNDILFYSDFKEEKEVNLTKGSFIVFPTNIVHRTDYSEHKQAFKKVVVKIKSCKNNVLEAY